MARRSLLDAGGGDGEEPTSILAGLPVYRSSGNPASLPIRASAGFQTLTPRQLPTRRSSRPPLALTA